MFFINCVLSLQIQVFFIDLLILDKIVGHKEYSIESK